MSAETLAHWRPREMVLDARQRSLQEFVAECETPYLLLVRLDDPTSDLALGLAAQQPREQGRDGLGFRTVQRNISSVIESLEAAKEASKRAKVTPPEPRAPSRVALRGNAAGPTALSAEIRTGTYHVLPLRKRSEAAFLRSVSVGRARNHDIVLRHRSVSKFHGSFDFDEQGRLFVRDANSSNHTFVNGTQVVDPTELKPGDHVQFGSVDTHLCSAEDFWRTLHP